MPLGNFEILHTLKCVLGAPEALFCARTHLQVAIFDLRFQIEKYTTYGALASRLCSSHVQYKKNHAGFRLHLCDKLQWYRKSAVITELPVIYSSRVPQMMSVLQHTVEPLYNGHHWELTIL